jgi:hypothetical protein
MNWVKLLLITGLSAALMIGCNGTNDKGTTTSSTTPAAPKDAVAQQGETAIENASQANRPKGSLSFSIDGQSFSAVESTVQCMFVGMGSKDMAQGIISGNGTGFSVSGVMMTKPQTGEIKNKGIAATSGLAIIKDGTQYNSGPDVKIIIEKITPSGSNYYIGGTFGGTFTSLDGKKVTVSNGVFESGYL